ncbi:MAG TPA: hypothetical protein VFE25_01940 [Opitutaceae bacterium]|jgi:hypothetical protein|nr:hypothetical protein [Opitutaceae bacterium]
MAIALFWTKAANSLLAFDPSSANDVIAVTGRVSSDYSRGRMPDGSFKPEAYAFGEGGKWPGAKADKSMDATTFLEVARVVAVPLASKAYIPTRDPKSTKLLIMVYWGTTHAPEHPGASAVYQELQTSEMQLKSLYEASPPPPETAHEAGLIRPHNLLIEGSFDGPIAAAAAENRVRDQDDFLNAKMLGYDSWWNETNGDRRGTAFQVRRDDLLSELEDDRYFVVLMAYDFQIMWKQKKHKLLWETRFSIRQRHHNFDEDLSGMAQFASRFFGQETHGLIHDTLPEAHVEVGEVKSLGAVSDPQGK